MQVKRGDQTYRTIFRCEHHGYDTKIVFYTSARTEGLAEANIRSRALSTVGNPPRPLYRRHVMQECCVANAGGDRERVVRERFFDVKGDELLTAAASGK